MTLKQFINRIKFIPRAVKQSVLNIVETGMKLVRVFLVTAVSMVLCALWLLITMYLFIRYNCKPSLFNRKLDQSYFILDNFFDKFKEFVQE